MTCHLCKTTPKTWTGGERKCAFNDASTFSPDNWNCEVLRNLRYFIDDYGSDSNAFVHLRYADDERWACIPINSVEKLPEGDLTLWVQWYKSRGCTHDLYILSNTQPPRRPSYIETLHILRHIANLHYDGNIPYE